MDKESINKLKSMLSNGIPSLGCYILDENNNVVKGDLIDTAIMRESGRFIVKQEMIGDIKISTVFLGVDHSFDFLGDHIPIVFETMIFGGEHNDYQTRCATWDQALEMHQTAVDIVNGGKNADGHNT